MPRPRPARDAARSLVRRRVRDDGLLLPAEYQRERRTLAADRKAAAFAVAPTGPNQVWQLDFSELETSSGGTWDCCTSR